jgi:MYXO-CTERM domain-containing protein
MVLQLICLAILAIAFFAADTALLSDAHAARANVPVGLQSKKIPVYLNYSDSAMCYGNLEYTAFELEELEFMVNEVIENHNAASVSHPRLEYGGVVCLEDPFPYSSADPDAVDGRYWFTIMEMWTGAYDLEEHFPGIIVTAPPVCPATYAATHSSVSATVLRERVDLGGRTILLRPDDLSGTLQEEAEANGWPVVPWVLVYLARVYDDDGTTVCPTIDVDKLRTPTRCSLDAPGVVGDPCPMGVGVNEIADDCSCWDPEAMMNVDGDHLCVEAPDDDEDMMPDDDPRISSCYCPMTGAKLFSDAPGILDPALVSALAPVVGDPATDVRCDVEPRKSMTSTLAHEMGHALGIDHPFQDASAGPGGSGSAGSAVDVDELVDSVMSYNRDESNRAYGHSNFRLDDLEALRYVFHDPPLVPVGWTEPVAGANDWQYDFVTRWRGKSVAIGSSPPAAAQWNAANVVTSIETIVAPSLSTGATRVPGENHARLLAIAWVDDARAVHVRTMGPSGLHSLPDTEVPDSSTPHRPAVALAHPGIMVAWVADVSTTEKVRDIEWAIRPAGTADWDEWASYSLAAGMTEYCASLSPCPDVSPCVLEGATCEYDGGLANLSGRLSVGYDQDTAEFLLAYPASNLDLAVIRISAAGEVMGWNYFHAGNDPRYITHFSRPLCTKFTNSPLSSSVCSIVFIDNPHGDVRALQWAPEGADGVLENQNVVDLGIKGIAGVELVGEGWATLGEYTLILRGENRGLDAYALTLQTTAATFPVRLPNGFTVASLAGLSALDVEEEEIIPNWPPALGNRFSDDLASTVYTVWAAAPEPDNDPGTPYGDTDTDGNWGEAGSGCGCSTRTGGPGIAFWLISAFALFGPRRRKPQKCKLVEVHQASS